MPAQLLPLRMLTSSGVVRSSRSVSILGRAFPFKLKYLVFSSKPRLFTSGPIRAFSSRPIRSRSSIGGGSRDNRRGNFQAGSIGGQGKSLIDDEAELSDWISDLKTESLHLGLSSESEDSDRDRAKSSKSWDMGRDRVRVSDRERDSRASSKRPRGSDSNGFSVVSERRKPWDSNGPAAPKPRGSRPMRRFDSDSEKDVEVEAGVRRREHGGRGGFSAKRGGRDLGSSNGRSSGPRSHVLEVSDEEEEETEDDDVMSGFGDGFLSGGEGKKEGFLKEALMNETSSPEVVKGDSPSPTPRSTGGSDSYLSQTRFDQCSISPLSLKGIKAAGYERMTVVQEATLPIILKGKDVLAKAKTGTGKTVAFLLPAIEVIVKLPPVDRDQKRPPINVLVICPTRELAGQAATEANALLKYHSSIGVQVIIGGTRLALEQKRMQANPCQILVATPGRLRDHIENTPGFASRLMGVKVLILDEADRLLDMGFRKDIDKIVAAVPKQRQTLLFSATVPQEVRQVCYNAMKRDHEFVNTVVEGTEETHTQVKQMHLVAPLEKHFSILYRVLTEHISEDVDYKVIVFCTTAMVTRLVADLLSELNLNVREIHSRKPQSYRTRVSDEFRKSKGLILVTSDVSARGVDYPDVTLVIQVGVPSDREQYIHRLGRTGRKGKEGQGILMLAPWEEFFLSSIKNLPITEAPLPPIDPDTRKKVERALSHVEMKNKEAAYQAWLGYYNSNKNVGKDKHKLVALANEFSRSMGLDNPPAIAKLVLGKMGLKNVPGLRAK